MTKIRKHKRKGRVVREHTRRRGRNITSSFLDRVSEDGEGGMTITILGREYPYPFLPKNRVSGLLGKGSAGKYYNKYIRGNYF